MNLRTNRRYALLLLLPLCGACQAVDDMSTSQKDTAIGGLVGAGAGALAGGAIKGISGTEGAIGGALLGGLLGHFHGKSTETEDRQQAEINHLQSQLDNQ